MPHPQNLLDNKGEREKVQNAILISLGLMCFIQEYMCTSFNTKYYNYEVYCSASLPAVK